MILKRNDKGKSKVELITELEDLRKELEGLKQNRQQEKNRFQKERKLETIGTLAGGIAHDFNNLLSIIMGNISLVKDGLSNEDFFFKLLENAEKASIKASELANKFISFSSGGWIEKSKLKVNSILQTARVALSPDLEITFNMDLDERLYSIHGDKDQLVSVISNLYQNAIEAMPDDKTIVVKAENMIVKGKSNLSVPKGKYVKILIKDRGCGIPKKNINRIFDPYFSTKRIGVKIGLGLGLTLCYSIIKNHGGLINIDSEWRQGTQVSVYLPAFDSKRIPPWENAVVDKKRRYKILLMNDEPALSELSSLILKKDGYDIDIYWQSSEVIKAFKEARKTGCYYDLVILNLDNKLGLGGRETLACLRKINPKIRAIALGKNSNKQKIEEIGFCELIEKPLQITDLRDKINKIMGTGT
jgi:signal transduction histidine kinase